MKAVVCTKLGEPNLLEIKEVDKPTINKDEVLIKVEVAGVNFPDALLVQGKYQIVIDPPFIPGNDCLLYTSPSPRDATLSRMPSSA